MKIIAIAVALAALVIGFVIASSMHPAPPKKITVPLVMPSPVAVPGNPVVNKN